MTSERVEIRLDRGEVSWEDDCWIGLSQCESYALTFLVKHPERISRVRELGGGWELKGVEVWLAPSREETAKGKRADLVFTRERANGKLDYLIIEAEDDCTERKLNDGWVQALGYAELLKDHLQDHQSEFENCGDVFVAVAAVDWGTGPRGIPERGWTCGDEWKKA